MQINRELRASNVRKGARKADFIIEWHVILIVGWGLIWYCLKMGGATLLTVESVLFISGTLWNFYCVLRTYAEVYFIFYISEYVAKVPNHSPHPNPKHPKIWILMGQIVLFYLIFWLFSAPTKTWKYVIEGLNMLIMVI